METTDIRVVQRAFEAKAYDADAPLPVQISEPVNPDRVIRFRASDDSLDRHNEVILPEGWQFTDFVKNPVMMQFHDYSTWPIGKVVAAGVVDGALYVDGEFDPPEIDESAEMIFQKIKHGTISAGSVGFIPKEIITPSVKNRDIFERYPKAERIYAKQELLEWTICPIPANPNALAASYKKRFGTDSVEASAHADEVTAGVETDAVENAVAVKLWDMSWRLRHGECHEESQDAEHKDGE